MRKRALKFHQWMCRDEFQSVRVVLAEGVSLNQVLQVWDVDSPADDDVQAPVFFEGASTALNFLPFPCCGSKAVPGPPLMRRSF